MKAKPALAAVRGDRTTSQVASGFGVHVTQTGQWKRRLVEEEFSVEAVVDDPSNKFRRLR